MTASSRGTGVSAATVLPPGSRAGRESFRTSQGTLLRNCLFALSRQAYNRHLNKLGVTGLAAAIKAQPDSCRQFLMRLSGNILLPDIRERLGLTQRRIPKKDIRTSGIYHPKACVLRILAKTLRRHEQGGIAFQLGKPEKDNLVSLLVSRRLWLPKKKGVGNSSAKPVVLSKDVVDFYVAQGFRVRPATPEPPPVLDSKVLDRVRKVVLSEFPKPSSSSVSGDRPFEMSEPLTWPSEYRTDTEYRQAVEIRESIDRGSNMDPRRGISVIESICTRIRKKLGKQTVRSASQRSKANMKNKNEKFDDLYERYPWFRAHHEKYRASGGRCTVDNLRQILDNGLRPSWQDYNLSKPLTKGRGR